jgi:hypothetical protein
LAAQRVTCSIVPAPGCCKNASGSRNSTGCGAQLSVLLYFIMFLGAGNSTTLRFPLFPRLAVQKGYVFHSSRAWRLKQITFSIVPAPGSPKTLRFPSLPRLAARKRYVVHSSRAWRLRNVTFSILPAHGLSYECLTMVLRMSYDCHTIVHQRANLFTCWFLVP